MQIGYRFKNYTVSRFINSVKQFINNMATTDIGFRHQLMSFTKEISRKELDIIPKI